MSEDSRVAKLLAEHYQKGKQEAIDKVSDFLGERTFTKYGLPALIRFSEFEWDSFKEENFK